MFDNDVKHHNKSLQNKLFSIYKLRSSRINLDGSSEYANLLKKLGNPQDKIPATIHIAGTNGKGSTLAFLEQLLKEMGKTSHKLTSPHLLYFNERIVIAGKEIDDNSLEKELDYILKINDGAECSFFEIATALAFHIFAKYDADYTLLETGLGGRLDCTNYIKKPIATIIASIGYDHTEFLGDTIEKIAMEKAGIIKRDVPCILASQKRIVLDVVTKIIKEKCEKHNTTINQCGSKWVIVPFDEEQMIFKYSEIVYKLPRPRHLIGDHQISNFGTALATLMMLGEKDKDIIPTEIQIVKALNNTKWAGRLEKIEINNLLDNHEIYFDGGHNEDAAYIISEQLDKWKKNGYDINIVIGMMAHKDANPFIKEIIGHVDYINILEIEHDKESYKFNELKEIIEKHTTNPINKITNINEISQLQYKNKTITLITGSLYLYEQIKILQNF